MSCSPLSWFFVSADRYEYSFGNAASSRLEGFENDVREVDTRLVRRAEVSRGIGSSRLEDWFSSGRNGL